jgi:flavin reductase (DIM6/NTAB) family NADH-FMN oxidoreductase RutF
MNIDLSTLSSNSIYHTMIQSIVPRPVAWVLSDNGNESLNLAPFSYFSAVSSNPPLIMLSIGKKPNGSAKDTLTNIEQREQFVVHIAHREMVHLVNESALGLEFGESELDMLGLTTEPFENFRLPRLKDCRIAMACERYRVENITENQAMVLAEVKFIYIADDVVSESNGKVKIHADKIDPISRLGGEEYATLGNIITIPRPR